MIDAESLIPKFTQHYPSILIFGPPGAGKGTQGKFLCNAGNHYHLSSGDIFRSLSPESPAGKLFHTYANRGFLVPDNVTIEIWRNYVEGLIATNRYHPDQQCLLLDGLPRTVAQAEVLDQFIEVRHIIVLEIKNIDALVQRLKRRALIERRLDDADEVILRTRMEVYEKETAKLLAHYPDSVISRFNAEQTPLEVLRDILVKLAPVL